MLSLRSTLLSVSLVTLLAGCAAEQPPLPVTKASLQQPAKTYPSIPPTARATDLHYPNFHSLEEAVADAESRLTMRHYRKALQKADPLEQYPDRAGCARAFARPIAADGSLEQGVVVDVDLWSVEALESHANGN